RLPTSKFSDSRIWRVVMNRILKSPSIPAMLLIGLIAFVNVAHSQVETGQITGTVYDPSGAVVPNAKITVKSNNTGFERQTISTSSGAYAVTNLQPGRYMITAEASGFSTVQQTADVSVGGRVGLDLKMEVGGVQAAVEVVEAAGLINTETQTLSQTVTGNEVL